MNILEITGIESIRSQQLPHELKITLSPGAGLGIFGPNGSGKSSLLDIIAGIVPHPTAQLKIAGRLGYAMQKDGFHENLTCWDNLVLEANYAQLPPKSIKERIAECARLCGSTEFLNVKTAKLSAGMRARLSLTAALLGDPQILLLDESFNALDEQSAATIKSMLQQKKQAGLTLLFVSHDRQELQGLCEQILYFPQLKEVAL